jgi:hypothetical protein
VVSRVFRRVTLLWVVLKNFPNIIYLILFKEIFVLELNLKVVCCEVERDVRCTGLPQTAMKRK